MRTIWLALLVFGIGVVESRHKHHSKRTHPHMKRYLGINRPAYVQPQGVSVVFESIAGKYYQNTVNIGTKSASTAAECANLCESTSQCTCASFNGASTCWLHRQCPNPPVNAANWNAVAPVAFNHRKGRKYVSCNNVGALTASTAKDCAQKCAWKANCMAADFTPSSGACSLCSDYGLSYDDAMKWYLDNNVIALEKVQLKLSTWWQATPGPNPDTVGGVSLQQCLTKCVVRGAGCCGASYSLAGRMCYTHSGCDAPARMEAKSDSPWVAYKVKQNYNP